MWNCFGKVFLIGYQGLVGYTRIVDVAHSKLLVRCELGEGLRVIQMVTQHFKRNVTAILSGDNSEECLRLLLVLRALDEFVQGLPVATSIETLELLPDEGGYVLSTDRVFDSHTAIVLSALGFGDVGVLCILTWWRDEEIFVDAVSRAVLQLEAYLLVGAEGDLLHAEAVACPLGLAGIDEHIPLPCGE